MKQRLPNAAKTAPSSRREKNRQEKRQLLLDTAVEVFVARGYHGTRIEDIITHANIGKGTFYLYFHDKEELFCALIDEFFGGIKQTLQWVLENVDPTKPLAEIFREETRQFFRLLSESKDLARVFFRDGKSGGPKVEERINAHYREIIKISTETLQFAVNFGLLGKLQPKVASALIIGGIEKVYELWLRGELKGPESEIAAEASAFLIRGCGLEPAP